MKRILAVLWLLCVQAVAFAADGLHPWVVPAPRLLKETYFSNLQDGAAIETPFLLKFGLTGMGIAPIVKPVAMTGHHHLLVNRDLPLDFSKPLPFNDQYIHFGKGQMETVLTFAPGKYQLRLVFADEKHIPNFVYSKPLNITVTKKNDNVDPKSLVTKGVAIQMPRSGDKLSAPFRVAMHASGMNISSIALARGRLGPLPLARQARGRARGSDRARQRLHRGLAEAAARRLQRARRVHRQRQRKPGAGDLASRWRSGSSAEAQLRAQRVLSPTSQDCSTPNTSPCSGSLKISWKSGLNSRALTSSRGAAAAKAALPAGATQRSLPAHISKVGTRQAEAARAHRERRRRR